MVDIHQLADPDAAARAAGEAVVSAVKQFANRPILLLLSGGSALKVLEHISAQECASAQVTLGVLDERFSADASVNNFSQLSTTTFFRAAIKLGVSFIDTRPLTGESIEELAHRFEQTMKTWKMGHADGVIIITQGMGADGHTAGVLPHTDDPGTFASLFDDPSVWVVGYNAGAKSDFPLRVTVTLPFLRMVDTSVVYVCGSDKLRALTQVTASSGNLHEVPGRIVHEMKHCHLYTDQAVGRVKI